MIWKNLKKINLGIILCSIALMVFVLFQNCSNIHLTGVSNPSVADVPQPAPVTTVTMQPGFTPTQSAPPVYTSCMINASSWWLGTRYAAAPGSGLGLQCLFTLSANQYLTYHFHTPTLADAQKNIDATMGNLVLNGAFFAISDVQPGQSFSAPTNCTNNKNVFLNWALSGATTDQVVGLRSDVCFLKPDTDYWVVVAQSQAVDPNVTPKDCGLSNNQCLYKFDINDDTVVVNEGYDAAPTCQYQPNDPTFAQSTAMAVRGGGSPGNPNDTGWEPTLKTVDVNPQDFGFDNVINTYWQDTFMAPALNNFGLDFGVSNPLYPSNSKTTGIIVALKFLTPQFGENAELIVHELGIEAGYQSSVGPYTNLQSISECPGDFNSSNASKRIIVSGYNLLQANGHYINQDIYTMGTLPSRFPSGVFQTQSPSIYYALKPNTVYYYNVEGPATGCHMGLTQSPSSSMYCATGRTNDFRAGDPSGFGQLFILSEQK